MNSLAPAGRAVVQHQPAKQAPLRKATLQRKCACGGETHGGAECEQCRRRRERTVQRAAFARAALAPEVPQIVRDVLRQPGRPLDDRTRLTMESRFAHDFSRVRLHDDSAAASAAHSVEAHAFTVGDHVVFGHGQFALHHAGGRRLLAHELAHVVQQQGAVRADDELSVSTDTRAEAMADLAASRVMAGVSAGYVGETGPQAAQRQEKSVFGSIASKVAGGMETLAIKSIAGPARVVSPIAGRLVEAMLWGMLDEYKVQSPDRAAQAWERVKEAAKSPLVFLKNYWWGLIKGIFSPITGLFDMAKLAVKLQAMQAQLLGTAWKNREAVAQEAGQLADRLTSVGALGKTAIKGMTDNPVATMKALDGWLTSLGNAAEEKARGAGHDVMKSLMGTLDKPMDELAEIAGEIVGTVLINVVLLVFTAGIGDAIAQIAARLGELGSYLGKLGEAAAMVGKLVGKIGELLGVVGGWIAKAEGVIAKAAEAVLKPISPLLKELGNLVGGLRTFLRKLLGLADEAATAGAETAASAAARQLEGRVPKPTVPPVTAPPPASSLPKPIPKPSTAATNVADESLEALGGKGASKTLPPEVTPPPVAAPPRAKVFDGISKETEALLAKRPGLAKALSEHPNAADLFKLCESPCFPSFLSDEEMVARLLRLERMEAEAAKYGVQFDRGPMKKLLHRQETLAELDATLDAIEQGLAQRIRTSWQPIPGEPPPPLGGAITKPGPARKPGSPTQFEDLAQKPPAGAEDVFERPGVNESKTPGGGAENPKTATGKWVDRNVELLQRDPKILDDIVARGHGPDPIFDFQLPKGLVAEYQIPHPYYSATGKPRIDRLWRHGDTIFELKPNTLSAVRGEAQAQQYAEWMNRLEKLPGGRVYKWRVVQYDQTRLMAYLKSMGVLP